LFLTWAEFKPFFLAIDVETDYSNTNINLSIGRAQEWTSQNEWYFIANVHVKYYKVHWNEAVSDLHRDVPGYPR
jgi:hypothetical protein